MTTDLFKTILWNDGEGITSGDLNAGAMWGVARMTDQILEHLAGGPLATATKDPDQWGQNDDDTDMVALFYTLTGGEAVLWSSGTNVLKVTAGTIFQKVANADGEAMGFLPFSIRDADLSFNLDDGDPADPRVDILQGKLELVEGDSDARDFKDAVTGALSSNTPDKTRRVQATFSIKKGVAAASPDYPVPDAGYAVLGAVRIPGGWVAADAIIPIPSSGPATIRQCSIPLRIESHITTAFDFDYAQSTNWSQDTTSGGATSGTAIATGAASDLYCWAPVASMNKRVVAVKLVGSFLASAAAVLETVGFAVLVGYQVIESFTLTGTITTIGSLTSKMAHLGQIAEASADSNPSAANGPVGDPVWAAGGKSGPAQRATELSGSSGAAAFSRLRLRIDGGDGSFITSVIWYLAG